MNTIANRYDFLFLFDVENANPNGDPDAGNLPRVDPQTGHGLVTDVCLKRKVRNFITHTKELQSPYNIYIQDGTVLGDKHRSAFEELKINLGKDFEQGIDEATHEELSEAELPEGLRLAADGDDFKLIREVQAQTDEIKAWQKEADLPKKANAAVTAILKAKGVGRPPSREQVQQGHDYMCQHYYDVRAFGAVMSLKSAPNCGQVRGPVQIGFARSIDPVFIQEHSITRCAVATTEESKKQSGGNRTMGRKFTIPYGLYKMSGAVNPFFADKTKFNETDLEVFFTALEQAFTLDASAARPADSMRARALLVFRHDGNDTVPAQRAQQAKLGCAPSHKLFEKFVIERTSETPRAIVDYKITFDGKPLDDTVAPPNGKPTEHDLGNGITLIRRI